MPSASAVPYWKPLIYESWAATWELVVGEPLARLVILGAIVITSVVVYRRWKRLEDYWATLRGSVAFVLSSALIFALIFMAQVLFITPKRIVDRANREKETAQNVAKDAEAETRKLRSEGSNVVRLDVNEKDPQARAGLETLTARLETSRVQGEKQAKELEIAKAQLDKAQSKIRELDPTQQAVASIEATVEVFVKSGEQFGNRFMDAGGAIAIAHGSEALLATSSQESIARTVSDQLVKFQGFFNLAPTGSLVGKPISTLRADAEYIQIEFVKLPLDAEVLSGTVVITLNGSQGGN